MIVVIMVIIIEQPQYRRRKDGNTVVGPLKDFLMLKEYLSRAICSTDIP